ncbi:unnamed protein product [Schistosoma mattheei]|nr:unnamed protein product [Schistosoma mattheei]
MSNNPLIDPDTISNNGNTLSYSPRTYPRVQIYHTRNTNDGYY